MTHPKQITGLQKIITRLFLYKVYQFNKKLFVFFFVFASLTVICNLLGDEITPFFVWGMYSEKEVEPSEYEIFRITSNDKLVDYSKSYLPANRFFLQSPPRYYLKMSNAGDPTEAFLKSKLKENFSLFEPIALKVLNSKNDLNEFPAWYQRYLQQTTGEPVLNFKVEILKMRYDSTNVVNIMSVNTLIDGK